MHIENLSGYLINLKGLKLKGFSNENVWERFIVQARRKQNEIGQALVAVQNIYFILSLYS